MIQIQISIDRQEGMPDFQLHLAKCKQVSDALTIALKTIAPDWTVISPAHSKAVLFAFPPGDVAGFAGASSLLKAN